MSERTESNWHIVWSSTGFGSTHAKLVELCEAVKRDDPDGGSDVFFPTYLDRLRDRDILVPLFPNYVFVKCRWHAGLEERILENSGISVSFLRAPGMDLPHVMSAEELKSVKDALESSIEVVQQWMHVGDLAIGDFVVVKSMNLAGKILYFLPPSRVMIETKLFNQETPVPVKISEIERA